MNHPFDQFQAQSRTLGSILAVATVALPLMLLPTKPATAAPSDTATCAVKPASLDARLAAKRQAGTADLVRFVYRTRMIYQMDIDEAVARADRYERRNGTCAVASRTTWNDE